MIRQHGSTSNKIVVVLADSSSTTGEGLTGLTNASSGLIISTRTDNEATTTNYTAAGSDIETIATLGTYAAPSTDKCRFKEIDATNKPGQYEIHLADARFSVSGATKLDITISGATDLVETHLLIELVQYDPQDSVRLGLTALPDADADAAGGLPISDLGGLDLDTFLGRLDASITSRLASASYSAPDNSGITDLKDRLTTVRAGYLDNLENHVPQTGDSYTRIGSNGSGLSEVGLSTSETTAIATAVEAAILNEGDGQMVIDAMVQAIDAADIAEATLVALIRADLERAGGVMQQILEDTGTTVPGLIGGLNDIAANEIVSNGAITTNSGAVSNVTTVTTATSITNKTGFKLASDGLDSISTAEPSGVASNFTERLNQLWRRLFKKTTMTSTQLKTYADDGTTVITTQTVSDDGTTQTQGDAS